MTSSSGKGGIDRAISIRQPFAEQILQGKKKIEWRGTNSRLRERIYIYASKGMEDDQAEWRKAGVTPGSLPTGVIVGTVEIVDATFDEDEFQYAWHLARPERLRVPLVPVNHPQPVIWRPRFAKMPAQPRGSSPKTTHERQDVSKTGGGGITGELVCYHNPDVMGREIWALDWKEGFAAYCARRYAGAEGKRVWFVTGRGSPRRYYVAGWFRVDEVEDIEDDGEVVDQRYGGTTGQVARQFSDLVEIGKAPWFKDLRRACANFATRQHVRDVTLLGKLEETWRERQAAT